MNLKEQRQAIVDAIPAEILRSEMAKINIPKPIVRKRIALFIPNIIKRYFDFMDSEHSVFGFMIFLITIITLVLLIFLQIDESLKISCVFCGIGAVLGHVMIILMNKNNPTSS